MTPTLEEPRIQVMSEDSDGVKQQGNIAPCVYVCVCVCACARMCTRMCTCTHSERIPANHQPGYIHSSLKTFFISSPKQVLLLKLSPSFGFSGFSSLLSSSHTSCL